MAELRQTGKQFGAILGLTCCSALKGAVDAGLKGALSPGVESYFLRMEIKVFNLEPSECCSSVPLCADDSERVLAGVDAAGGEEDDVEGIVPFASPRRDRDTLLGGVSGVFVGKRSCS